MLLGLTTVKETREQYNNIKLIVKEQGGVPKNE